MVANKSGLKPPWPKGTSGFKGQHHPRFEDRTKALETSNKAHEAMLQALMAGWKQLSKQVGELTEDVRALVTENPKLQSQSRSEPRSEQSQSQPRSEVPPSPEPAPVPPPKPQPVQCRCNGTGEGVWACPMHGPELEARAARGWR